VLLPLFHPVETQELVAMDDVGGVVPFYGQGRPMMATWIVFMDQGVDQ
jgi:hypothetical protein